MRTGKFWGSAEHRAIIAKEKKEVLELVKELSEKYLLEPSELTKRIIDDQYTYYKRLLDLNLRMIKTAHEKYITLRSGEVAIPLNNTRTNESGETEAEVLCFMQSGAFRNVWIQRKDIQ